MSFFNFGAGGDQEEFNDELNNETFGMDISSIKNSEFTFGQEQSTNTTANTTNTTLNTTNTTLNTTNTTANTTNTLNTLNTTRRVLTVEELEAQFNVSISQQSHQLEKASKILTLEELESQLVIPKTTTPTLNINDNTTTTTSTTTMENTKKYPEYDGLMMKHEKELVAKIQLGPLASDSSYIQDYYYRRFKEKHSSSSTSTFTSSLIHNHSMSSSIYDSGDQSEMEKKKFDRILSEVKAASRPKADKLAFEGALGKIAVNSLRNPKKLLEIEPVKLHNSFTPSDSNFGFSFRTVLGSIETVLQHLIHAEDLLLIDTDKPNNDDINDKFNDLLLKIWTEIHNVSKTDKVQSPSHDLLTEAPPEKSLILYLSVSKGRKSIPRILKLLPRPQTYILLKSVLVSLKHIMITSAEPVSVLSELDEYANCVVYPFVPSISESSLSFVLDCLSSLLAIGEVVSVARTKPGVLLLTLFISRAELLKQQQQAATDEILKWSQFIFPSIFTCFQTRFSALFPPSHIMPPIISSNVGDIIQPIPVDDQYAWQFVAALAIGASLDQQRILVSELRDKIFEVVSMQGAEGVRKANLLLNALGLDASQLAL